MRPTRRFVVEVTMVVDDAGTEQTFLIGSDRWMTKPTDVPANTRVLPYLLSAGTLTQEIWADGRFTGPIRPSYGNIVVMNPQPDPAAPGKLSAWLRYGMAGARIVVRRGIPGQAYPSQYTTVYIAYGYSFVPDGETITIRLRDRTQLFDTQVLDKGFLGTGGLEGNGSVPKLQQLLSGDGFIPVFLVDSVRQIYFVHSNATYAHNEWQAGIGSLAYKLFENGVEIERDPDYASETDLLNIEPAEGMCRFWFGPQSLYTGLNRDGPVFVRIDAPPTGELRVYAIGTPNDADIARNGGVPIGSFTFKLLAMRAGIDEADIDGADDPIGNAFIDDSQTYLDLMARSCIASQSWVGFSRLDRLQSGTMFDPTSETEEHTFTESNCRDLKRLPVPGNEVPVWKVFVKSGKAYPCQINAGAEATVADLLSREWRSTFTGVSDTTKLKNPGAVSITIELDNGNNPNQFSRDRYLTRLFGFIGGQHDYFTLTCDMNDAVLSLGLGSVVKLKSVLFDMAAGQNYMVAGMKIDCDSPVPAVQFWLWGGTPGEYTGPETKIPTTNTTPRVQLGRRVYGPFLRRTYGTAGGSVASGFQRVYGPFLRTTIGTAVPLVDPYISSVVLLMHCEGTNGSTTFIDSSPANHTLTATGNAQHTTSTPLVGTSSLLVDGTAPPDMVTALNSADWQFGSGDFTVELTVQFDTLSSGTNRACIAFWDEAGANRSWWLGLGTTNKLLFLWSTDGSGVAGSLTGSTTLADDVTYRLAVSRVGGTVYAFLDGSVEDSDSISGSLCASGGIISVGAMASGTTLSDPARYDELRVTKGVGRYSGSYTPMTSPFPNS